MKSYILVSELDQVVTHMYAYLDTSLADQTLYILKWSDDICIISKLLILVTFLLNQYSKITFQRFKNGKKNCVDAY